eukprot:TRINITY_DN9566_c0_g1_i12.p2 TRINITY_DN9566_c0_g1~~TRINITY_DN9566_c0_g1_i12.p2  ORF type:complete len:135 (+),score=16.52 TRINITY_DN9566_c0_g1_i12:138-542(+)
MQISRLPYFRSSGFGRVNNRMHFRSFGQVRASLREQILQKNKENPVMLYSKSWCPFCGQVKGLFDKYQIEYKVAELDELQDGVELQDALSEISGMSTVPQVFIKEKLIGGCDDVMAAFTSGKLKEYLGDIKSSL